MVIVIIIFFIGGIYSIISGLRSGTMSHVVIGSIIVLAELALFFIGSKLPDDDSDDNGSPNNHSQDPNAPAEDPRKKKKKKKKKKHVPVDEIRFHLVADDFQSNIKSLRTKENPAYNVSKKEFIDLEEERTSVYEYCFEHKDPEIVDKGDHIVALVAGVEVGTVKPRSVSRIKNLIKSGRTDHIDISLYGGKRKKYWTWTNHDGEEVLDFSCIEKAYSSVLSLYVTPAPDAATAPPSSPSLAASKEKKEISIDKSLSLIPDFPISLDGEKVEKKDGFTDDITHSRITVRTDIEKLGSYVAIDIETTGLSMTCDIIEVGAVKFENFQPIEKFSILTKPNRWLSPKITNLTGITDDMLVDSPHFYQILPSLRKFIGSSNIVAHNINFDIPRLIVNGFDFFGQKYKFYDTIDLAKRCLKKGFDVEDYKLETLLDYYHICVPEHHRASYDAIAAGTLFDIMAHQILEQ